VSGLKDEKLIKRETYTKTEAYKLCSTVFWTFLPNGIKIDPYNFQLYRFKVGAFFETQYRYPTILGQYYPTVASHLVLIVIHK